MLEVEVKFPCLDLGDLTTRLGQIGAAHVADRTDEDHYFNAPDRDFARTDEALRVRQIGDHNFVTYKGPRLDAQTKTRKEIEVPLEDGAEAATKFMSLLTDLGYRHVALVQNAHGMFHNDKSAR